MSTEDRKDTLASKADSQDFRGIDRTLKTPQRQRKQEGTDNSHDNTASESLLEGFR